MARRSTGGRPVAFGSGTTGRSQPTPRPRSRHAPLPPAHSPRRELRRATRTYTQTMAEAGFAARPDQLLLRRRRRARNALRSTRHAAAIRLADLGVGVPTEGSAEGAL